MAENAKRRRLDDVPNEQLSNNVSNYQIIAQNPLIDVNQAVVFNQLPVIQNQQLLYSLPQVQGLNSSQNGQQYYLFIPSNENVPNLPGLSITEQKENEIEISKTEFIPVIESSEKHEGDEKDIIQINQKDTGILQYNSEVIEIQQQPNEQVFVVQNENSTTANKNTNTAWKSQLYRCEHRGCSETFPSLHQKKLHLEAHIFPESDEYKCSICNMVFKKAVERNKHITTHSIVSTYKCKECRTSFPYYTTLIKHVENKVCSKTNPRECFYCKNKFYNTIDIVKHHKLCIKNCDVCAAYVCGDQALHVHKKTCKR